MPSGRTPVLPPRGRMGSARTCTLGWYVVARQALGLEGSVLPVYRLLGPIQSFKSGQWGSLGGREELRMCISNTFPGSTQGLHFESHCHRGTSKVQSTHTHAFIHSFNSTS